MGRPRKNAAPKAAAKPVEVKAEAVEVKAEEAVKAAEEAVKPVAEEKKPAAKKTAEKKTVEKKAPAKKTAEKKTSAKKTDAPESKVVVQFAGSEVNAAELVEKAKAACGVKDIKKVDVYVKPEVNKVYYVVNGDCFGDFDLF